MQRLVDGMNCRVEEGWFVNKDGRRIPVSYTVSAMGKGDLRQAGRLRAFKPQVECLGGELLQAVLNLVINAARALEAAI